MFKVKIYYPFDVWVATFKTESEAKNYYDEITNNFHDLDEEISSISMWNNTDPMYCFKPQYE